MDVVNSAVMNNGVYVSFWSMICSGHIPRSGVTGSYGSSVFSLLRKLHGVLHSGCTSFSSVQLLSHVWLFVTPWTTAHKASLSITNSQSLLKLMSISRWCHPAISSSVIPFSSGLQSFPAIRVFWVNSLHQVAKVLKFEFQHQSFQGIFRAGFIYNGLVGSPCNPRDSQESSPTPQFKSISSSALSFFFSSFLYSPTLTSILEKP